MCSTVLVNVYVTTMCNFVVYVSYFRSPQYILLFTDWYLNTISCQHGVKMTSVRNL